MNYSIFAENPQPIEQSNLADGIVIQNSRHEDTNESLTHDVQPSRTNSMFLQSQRLTKNHGVDDQIDIGSSPEFRNVPSLPETDGTRQGYGQKNNSTPGESNRNSDIIAGISADTKINMKYKKALENDVKLIPACESHGSSIECSEIAQPNIPNGTRCRGFSLERTKKERMVNEIISNNSLKPEVISTTVVKPLHESLNVPATQKIYPIENIRKNYGSWRRNLPRIPTEKAWSLEETGSGETYCGNVEKSVKEALTGVEQSTRSRKTSRSLRFFKEGLTPDDSRSKDIKGRGYSKEANPSNQALQTYHNENFQSNICKEIEQLKNRQDGPGSTHEGTHLNSHKAFDKVSPTSMNIVNPDYFDRPPSFKKISHEVASGSEEVVADTREYHNITPGSSKEDPFVQTMSLMDTERLKGIQSTDSSREIFEQQVYHSKECQNVYSSRSAEDDEDSGEEKISSALFLPHQMAQEVKKGHGERLDLNSEPTCQETSSPEEWLEEHVLSRNSSKSYDDKSKTSRSFFNTAESYLKNSIEESDTLMNPFCKMDSYFDSRNKQSIEKGSMSHNKYDDITPTGSSKLLFPNTGEISRSYTKPQPVTKKPLDAIELIPYSHQVGGHTTLWRFSKRAVCKQLNNRENEFYEKIEQRHPQLLQFLPRYIGVLNVTFERQNRSKNTRKEVQESHAETFNSKHENPMQMAPEQGNTHIFRDVELSEKSVLEHRRVISQSCTPAHLQPVPTVTFADNRHIIPTSILKPQPVYSQYQDRSHKESSSFSNKIDPGSSDGSEIGIDLSRKSNEPNPWGKTYVNKVLREDVFREVFLQKPVAIRHKKSASRRTSPYSTNNILRISNSESNLQTIQQGKSMTKSPLRIDVKASREYLSLKEPIAEINTSALEDSSKHLDKEINIGDGIEGSVSNCEKTYAGSCTSSKRQRRYSSGGLRRRPTEVADERGSLKYYEEADDPILDSKSDEVFTIESKPANRDSLFPKTKQANFALEKKQSSIQLSKYAEGPSTDGKLPSRKTSILQTEIPRPVNPKEARAQPGSRVEYFLLLEDLTAGMKRPCVMDLKMGTRQYGVDCDHKKQESQRKKCKATTSKSLGVRVCGLQVWDVYLQDYIFEDKYYGRSLKDGKDFQNALTRFLYDGVDYHSVIRHIPSILEKLSELEVIIRGLIGYRFYGTSLLMFYDGATKEEYCSDSTATGKDDRTIAREIDFKIADFANCVSDEDFVRERTCPPKHPEKPDLGFLRGLKTLKHFFLAIERDTCKEKGFVHFQCTYTGKDLNSLDENEDDGYVSY